MSKKIKTNIIAIMQLALMILEIIKQWQASELTDEAARDQIAAAIHLYYVKLDMADFSYVRNVEAAAEIMRLFLPRAGGADAKFGGVLEEIAKIGAIIDAIIEILSRIFAAPEEAEDADSQ